MTTRPISALPPAQNNNQEADAAARKTGQAKATPNPPADVKDRVTISKAGQNAGATKPSPQPQRNRKATE